MRRKFFIVLFSILVFCFSLRGEVAFGGGVGTTGMDFLKLRSAARPLGMGNAFVAVADDISTLAWNVGGLANRTTGQEFLFAHFSYLDGLGYNNIGYAIPGKGGAFGFGFTMFSTTAEEYDVWYNPVGEIPLSNQVLSFAYSRKFKQLFTYGAGVDILRSVVGNYSATSYGINLGGLYFAPLGIVVGFSGQNLGPKYQYKTEEFTGEEESLPSTYSLGVSKELKLPGSILLVTVGIAKDYAFRENVGIEYRLFEMFALRAGYRMGYDSGGFTLGGGLSFKPKGLDRFQLDYAFVPMGGLGNTHCVSVIAKF